MSEIYRKRGRAVRHESGFFIRVSESGEAVDTGDTFTCAPLSENGSLPELDGSDVEAIVREIRTAVSHPLSVERLIVTRGIARHEFGSEHWIEETRRVHLSIAFGSLRAIFDLADFDLVEIMRTIEALPRVREERESPQSLRLVPGVTAALLPSLVGVVPPNAALWQSAGGRDGKGMLIEDVRVESPPWPNWYRPSYRARPVRAPHNLRLECDVKSIDADLPVAVALLAPVSGLVMRVLCVDGPIVYPSTVRVARINAVGLPSRWYPYAAGSYGAEMVI